MPDSVRRAAGFALGALAAGGIAYTAMAIGRVRQFRRRISREPETLPPLTVFKPLHGAEPQLYERLRTFCDQQYPEFQVIFCASRADDAALDAARRLAREFPERDIVIAAGEAAAVENPKIANILGAYRFAKHPILVIADSDITVGPGYLRAIAASFADERTGAVTCVYGALPNDTPASRLGAMHLNDGFAPSVLVAEALEPLTYCFGATMAVRRDVLERAGGLTWVGEHLGDDYLLGQAVVRSGHRVELAPYVVQTAVDDLAFGSLWRRELRWARTISAVRPVGFAASGITYVLPLSLAFAAVSPTPVSLATAALAASLRLLLHYESGKTFAPNVARTPLLIPIRDVLSLAVWAASFFGRRVEWRSHGYHVEAGGRMAAGPNGM